MTLRTKITAVFIAATAVVIAVVGAFVYVRMGANLLETVDAGLRSRADIVVSDVQQGIRTAADTQTRLIEADEAFAQVLSPAGKVLESSPKVGGLPLVLPEQLASLDSPRIFERVVPGIDNQTRILAVPTSSAWGPRVVAVGASLQDRRDEMLQLAATLAGAGVVALALLGWAGWLVIGAALRPVERMRVEAAAISESEPDRRLHVPPGDDELSRLATTFNEVLERLHASAEETHRLVDDASHELRTPLTVLKAELDLALARARTAQELEASLRRASVETDRLARLANDLLVLSRVDRGRLPLDRHDVALAPLLEEATRAFRPRAADRDVRLLVRASPDLIARLDPVRIRQAVDNLLDNALRYAPPGSEVVVEAVGIGSAVRVWVQDAGPGMPTAAEAHAFEPFARGSRGSDDGVGAGLGLAIVRAVAEGHGGSARVEHPEGGGTRVLVELPA